MPVKAIAIQLNAFLVRWLLRLHQRANLAAALILASIEPPWSFATCGLSTNRLCKMFHA
jgi:hypothetical protein